MEMNLMRRKTCNFQPKMIGGKIGSILDLKQSAESQGTLMG